MESAPALPVTGRPAGVLALFWQAVPWLVVAALAVPSASLLLVPLQALFVHIPINYNEGWNAFHTQRLMSGGPLYPPVDSGVTSNYPPLSFYVVGALGRLIGDYVFAGRTVALASEAVVAVNVAIVARRLGAGPAFAAIAGLLFALFAQIHFSDYTAMDDPQWLGHALQTTALVLLLRDGGTVSLGRLAAAAALLLLGGLVKQNLVALPLSATAWLALCKPRLLLSWGVLCLVGLAAVAALATAAYGRPFFDQVIFDHRGFTGTTLAWVGLHVLPFLLPFLLLGLCGFVLGRRNPTVQLVGIYAAVSAIVGVASLSVQGVNGNALFDLLIALMPLVAMLGPETERCLGGRPWSAAPMAVALALPFFAISPRLGQVYDDESRDLANASQWQQAIDTIAHAPGPVMCGQLSLCYWAGRPSAVDFFNFGQRASRDPALADALASRIDQRGFGLIQEDRINGETLLPASAKAAIAKYYRVTQTAPTVLLTPRP